MFCIVISKFIFKYNELYVKSGISNDTVISKIFISKLIISIVIVSNSLLKLATGAYPKNDFTTVIYASA